MSEPTPLTAEREATLRHVALAAGLELFDEIDRLRTALDAARAERDALSEQLEQVEVERDNAGFRAEATERKLNPVEAALKEQMEGVETQKQLRFAAERDRDALASLLAHFATLGYGIPEKRQAALDLISRIRSGEPA